MDSESLEQVERQLAGFRPSAAPAELRASVLAEMHRELRASRWDWRLARAAAVLLVVGIGLNLAIGFSSFGSSDVRSRPVAHSNSQQSLLDTAVVVAQTTDAATGRRFARQLAVLSGYELSKAEEAAIDAAVQRATRT
jgi:hypothetical protein